MRKLLRTSVVASALLIGLAVPGTEIATADAQTPAKSAMIKTRLDLLSGTPYVIVISYLPSEITSVTCESWTMLGVNSWKNQNNFTIPAGPAVAVMNANKFDGYCKQHGSIVAHTDDGDYIGVLDRGDGNWNASTKLTFLATSSK